MSTTSRSSDVTGAASAALELAGLGWSVLPTRGKIPRLHNGLHGASTDTHAIRNWFEMWPDAGVAVRTGNGLLVLDVDGDAGADSLHDLERRHGKLPQTVTVRTGGGGAHYYFTVPWPVRNSAGKLGPGLDVRGDGGYVIAPPSIHPDTGRAYEWDNHPDDVTVSAIPTTLLADAQCGPSPHLRKRTPAREWVRMLDRIPEGARNDSLARLAGLLFARGLEDDVVARLVLSVNQTACKPPLPADEVIRIVESILRRHLRSVTT